MFNIFFYLLAGCFVPARAQQGFLNKAAIDSVPASGFYQINLLPPLTARLQPDMRDIRIADAAGKQIPYILKKDLPVFKENKFTALPVLDVKKEADGQTHIVIENILHRPLEELLIIIKNTAADRFVTLSGSDDNKNWFVIKEHIYLDRVFSDTSDRFVQALTFPKSSYRYFTIIINGKNVLPVNIVQAGIYEQSQFTGQYVPLTTPVLSQKDSSDKFSYVYLLFDNHYFAERLLLELKGPRFYNRQANIYAVSANSPVLLGSFVISSDKAAMLTIAAKTNRLLVKISNNDNPPLQVYGATAFQLKKYLLAYLEKDNRYQLLFTDSAALTPIYDLAVFTDSIANDAPMLHYGTIEKNKLPEEKMVAGKSSNKIIIWLAIGVAVMLLLFLSYKLAGEIKNKS